MSGAVFAFLLAYAAKATLMLAAAALLAALLRRAAAETRALVWSAALAGVLLLAPAHLLLPRWSPPVLRTLAVDAAAPRGTPDAVPAHRTAPGADA
ncbi:MAG TPA: hypothetical protein VEQ60_07380, partial [Longimicrobium sp.]|nr:hypothetical protein [Longimicrobium sp.]